MPSSARVTTRSANNNQHPGIVDRPRLRRTKQEMAAIRAQEAEEKLQKQLEKKAKIERIAKLERALGDDLKATPRPVSKRKLRHTETFRKTLVESSKGSEEESQPTDQDFESPSGDDVATKSGCEVELDSPPKKKKKQNKETVRAAIKAARSIEGAAGSHGAGKELPHGGCVSASAQGIINDGNGQIKATTNVLR